MKVQIQCKRDELLKLAQSVSGVMTSKVLPVLGFILVEAKDKAVTMTATNLENTIRSSMPAVMKVNGTLCFPGEKFIRLLRELTSKEVTVFMFDNNKIRIQCEKAQFMLNGILPDEYPEVPKKMVKASFSVSQEKFREMIRKTVYCASRDTYQNNLNGIYMKAYGGELEMVATDGRRLALIRTKIGKGTEAVLIPSEGLRSIVKLLRETGSDIKIGVEEGKRIFFEADNIMLVSQLIEQKFPEYKNIIPKEFKVQLTVDRDKMIGVTRRASVLTNDRNLIRIKLEKKVLSISANNAELGSSYDMMTVKGVTEDIEIGANSVYLLEALNNMDRGNVNINLNDSESVITAMQPDYTCLVMPVRLDG